MAGCRTVAPPPPAPASDLPRDPTPEEREQSLPDGLVEALRAPDAMEALLIVCERGLAPDEAVFHGYAVLERKTVEDPELRRRIGSALVHDFTHPEGVAPCFKPHHGVCVRRGETEYELVLCFECSRWLVFQGGTPLGGGIMAGSAQRALEQVVGAKRDRLFSDRTLLEWLERFRTLDGSEVPAEDVPGLEALAQGLAWEDVMMRHGVSLPSAAALRRWAPSHPAVVAPTLAAHLANDAVCQAWPAVLEILCLLGPQAAVAEPALKQLLERQDLDGMVHRRRGYDPFYAPGQAGYTSRLDAPRVRELAREALVAMGAR